MWYLPPQRQEQAGWASAAPLQSPLSSNAQSPPLSEIGSPVPLVAASSLEHPDTVILSHLVLRYSDSDRASSFTLGTKYGFTQLSLLTPTSRSFSLGVINGQHNCSAGGGEHKEL